MTDGVYVVGGDFHKDEIFVITIIEHTPALPGSKPQAAHNAGSSGVLISQSPAQVYSEKEGLEETMRILLAVLVVQSVIGAASAALKPIDTDIHPVDHKGVAVYKTTPQGELRINLYFPPNWKASDRRPAIIFFFAGSCATGSPAQFAATAEYFAARGLVASAPEYRIESVHHTSPERCVEDGKSTIRWLRMNARRLGIDTRRVIAGGGSSGASMAAFTAYNTAFEPDDEIAPSHPNLTPWRYSTPPSVARPANLHRVRPVRSWPVGKSPKAVPERSRSTARKIPSKPQAATSPGN